MKKTKQGFIVPLLLVIIGLLVLGGGTYFYTVQRAKAPAVGNSKIATTSPMIISGEYGYSDMSGYESFRTAHGPFGKPASIITKTKRESYIPKDRMMDFPLSNAVVGTLSPLSDSCGLVVEATVEIKNPEKTGTKDSNNNEIISADFARLVSKGKVFDDCAGDGGVVTRTERKQVSNTETSVSVAGMSKYVDSDFSFSFWYPSGWSVATKIDFTANTYQGGIYNSIVSI